jgi:chromosome segregation ATPase
MDDKFPTSMTAGTPATNPAETLRALQERAQSALAAQRARMGQLESQLTDQLDSISATIAEQLSSQWAEQEQAELTSSQIALLQQELEDVKAAWARDREQAASEATGRAQLFEQQRAELQTRADDLAVGRRDLESRQQALDDRATQLNGQERELRRIKDELDGRTQEGDKRQAQLTAQENQLAQSLTDVRARESTLLSTEQSLALREETLQAKAQQLSRDQADLVRSEQSWQMDRNAIEAERDGLRDQLAAAIAENQNQGGELATELAKTRRELAAQQIAWENEHLRTESERVAQQAERDGLRDQLAAAMAENQTQGGELATELAQARRELAAQQIAWENEHLRTENERLALQKELEAVLQDRAALTEKLANLTEQSQDTSGQFATQLADLQQQLEFQQSVWQGERSQMEAEVLALSHARDELMAALTVAGEQLESSRGQSDAAAERDELQQKFDLAIGDMQRLRGRVAELEQELASRPAADQTDSVELVRLRAERDELAHRITELERQPAAVVDTDTSQQITDLQRRFELAVEDVRDLKKQNAKLEAQIAAAKSVAPAAATPTAGTWESVKKQLLASLEGESGELTPTREKERASIQNTVRITDEVVANKDRQIDELKTKLTSGGASAVADGLDAAVDADAVIQKHRARIAQIEQEMEDKLRATEMQLSLERAKIAREQAQLTELRIELESMRGPNGTVGEAAGNAPKRRWLSKLGLGDEEKK